jgi:hypothetical protein
MQLIKPSVELWPCPDDWQEQVARAARLCYASEGGQKSADDFCDMLVKRGHISMFRHASRYFIIETNPTPEEAKGGMLATTIGAYIPNWLLQVLSNTPYAAIAWYKKKGAGRVYFISTNQQYLMDMLRVKLLLEPYEVTLTDYVAKANELRYKTALALIRYTVCVTTQISTSRELNRTSPNAIAEQSTRYVNFGKKGGITICLPHWYKEAGWKKRLFARVGWKVAEWWYMLSLKMGLLAQDARGFLPLDAATRVCYTYNVREWKAIMRLRLLGATGKPHPNAQIAAQMIHDVILPEMAKHGGNNPELV